MPNVLTESEETKKKLKEAYQALLIVSLNQPLGRFYENFSDDVKRRALIRYNYSYNEETVCAQTRLSSPTDQYLDSLILRPTILPLLFTTRFSSYVELCGVSV